MRRAASWRAARIKAAGLLRSASSNCWSPLDVIQIATYNGAVFLGKADQLGSVEAGKLADLVLLSRDPTADINNAKSIVFVMKNGRLVDESQLPLAGGNRQRRFTGG